MGVVNHGYQILNIPSEKHGFSPEAALSFDVDCTPAEARQFMGLPDFEPMQKRALEDIERRMKDSLDRYSPESLLTAWMQPGSMNTDWFQEILKRSTKL
jgi:hypothetical protein